MGYYVNPPNMPKEAWLFVNGDQTSGPTPITETHVPVCLMDNGPFTAAAACPNQRELDAFCDPSDHRPKVWFTVPREALISIKAL